MVFFKKAFWSGIKLKGCLLLGRKVMTNLDSILKSRDTTFLTKVRIVKAMVFPVVVYGCESWTINKAERWRIDALNCGVGECREPAWGAPPMAKVMRKEARHTQRRDRASGVPLDILEHLPPKPEPAYYFVLSPTPLTLQGAVPHHLFRRRC